MDFSLMKNNKLYKGLLAYPEEEQSWGIYGAHCLAPFKECTGANIKNFTREGESSLMRRLFWFNVGIFLDGEVTINWSMSGGLESVLGYFDRGPWMLWFRSLDIMIPGTFTQLGTSLFLSILKAISGCT